MSRNDIYSRPNRFIPSHPVFPPKYHAHRSEPPTASFPRSSPFLPPDYPRETETVSRPLPLPAIMKGSPEYANVRIALDEIQRISDESSARRAYRALSRECPNCSLTWSEWSRFESDHGCIRAASAVILQGLENMPGNEVLLEKRLKLAERLGDCNGILFSAREFLSLRGGKSARNVVEAGEALAKCNRGYAASVCFHSLSKHDYLTQGSLFLDFVRFVLKSENYGEAVGLLKSSLPKLSKYSPIWFYTLSVLEQDHTIFAPYGDIHARSTNQMLASFLRQALRHLPEEPKWKVFYIAAQAQLRSFTHIRLWTRTHKRFLPAFCAEYPRVVRQCLQYLHCCVQHCPTDYQWKVWLLTGRVLALAGRRKTAIQVGIGREFHPVSGSQHRNRAKSKHPCGVSGIGPNSGFHRQAENRGKCHRADGDSVPGRVEDCSRTCSAVGGKHGGSFTLVARRRYPRGIRVELHGVTRPFYRGETLVFHHSVNAPVGVFRGDDAEYTARHVLWMCLP